MAEIKTRPNDKSVTAFIDSIENETRRNDAFILLEMFSRLTGCKPIMWGDSIIGFGEYEYTNSRGTYSWLMTGFSPRKQNLSLYVMQGFDEFADDLNQIGPVKTAKSCLYITRLSRIDLNALEAFLNKVIVDMRARFKCTD